MACNIDCTAEDAALNECIAESERACLVRELRHEVLADLGDAGLSEMSDATEPASFSKKEIRAMHAAQRREFVRNESARLSAKLPSLLQHLAEGKEIEPEEIDPELVQVNAEDETGLLFRLATLLWSVPVSRGFGRRMRFLVRDRSNSKLVGIFALGDPVFNLRARDRWIGWTGSDRRERLVNVMDAYVVGAVPPYSDLLGGKLITSLIASAEVSACFEQRYGHRTGVISGQAKDAHLALVTVTSALGRSSMYNRLRLPGLINLQRIGETQGWGHFQVSASTFQKMRCLLELDGHPYASGHQYGDGPNWKMRVIREALRRVGMNTGLLKHGIRREIYAMPLAHNWRAFLLGGTSQCGTERPDAAQIARAALARWVIPRAQRKPEFRSWTHKDTVQRLGIADIC